MRCDECQFAMLDELYGLLEPAESATLAAHVASCPECATAFARARAEQDKIQKASTLSFPALQFTPPAEVPPSEQPQAVPSEYAGPRVITPRHYWMRWVVAAGIMLVASGTIGTTVRQFSNYHTQSHEIDLAKLSLKSLEKSYEDKKAEYEAAKLVADEKLAAAKKQHNELLQEWVTAQQKADRAVPFAVTVRGPAAAIPGAPNDYSIAAINDHDHAIAANIVATLVGQDGKEYFRTTTETAMGREANVRIPASAWINVTAKDKLTLHVQATNPITKQTSELNEPLRMMDAAYSTVLTTDSPLYRPGDTIRFRSLTLDRTRFEPPSHDLRLSYALIGPNNQIVQGLAMAGTTHLESVVPGSASVRPVIGPDGKAVRGIGCGEIAIPGNLSNGSYKLAVYELPAGWTAAIPPTNTLPLATRPILIQSYATHKWQKTLTFDKLTYGPGENVLAKLTVTNQGKPVANASPMIDATADNQPVIALDHPPTTDASGQVTIRFTLPKKTEIKQAVLRVTVLSDTMSESIIRPIPLVARSMTVEFFPEGGDLVAGVPNRVYVRGRLPNGKPADFAGTITDGTNTVATVQSEADADAPGVNRGIGVLTFTPREGVNYTLNLSRPIGLTTMTAKLPAAKADGVVLSIPNGVVANGEAIVANLYSTQSRKLVIGAYSRGTPVAHAAVAIEAGVLTPVTLTPDISAPGGVTRVTVFEEPNDAAPGRKELRPVAERLVFRAETKRLNLSVKANSKFDSVDSSVMPGGAASGAMGATRAADTPGAKVTKAGEAPTYTPGESVGFDILSTNERGEAVPAIVYAAVADEMLYNQADDQTDRSLPTHYLLNGEVQSPDSLERADFLLGNEPKAKRALDRLLGTQGWRRFAEQNPSEFRKTAKPDDADRLLLAVGSRAPVPADFKPSVQRVNETYRPKYEAVLTALELAESDRKTYRFNSSEAEQLSRSYSSLNGSQKRIYDLVTEIRRENDDETSSTAGMLIVVSLSILSLGLLIVRFTIARAIPERKLILSAAMALLVLIGLFVAVQAYLSIRTNELLKTPTRPIQAFESSMPGSLPNNENEKPEADSKYPGLENANGESIVIQPTKNPIDSGAAILLEADRIAEGKRVISEVNVLKEAREQRRSELKSQIIEGAARSEKIASLETAQPPFFVREYSHTQVPDTSRTDFTEVLYWNPVIVLPGDGASHLLSFQLSDSIASYRVTVAGHTLDGRLGQTVTRFKVNKPLVASAKLPAEIAWGDKVDLLASVQSVDFMAKTNLYIRGSNATIQTSNDVERESMSLDENGFARRVVRVEPKSVGPVQVSVWAVDKENHLRDIETRSIKVVPFGFPATGSTTAVLDQSTTLKVAVPSDRVDRSLELSIKAYANPLAELEASVVGIVRGPASCFEQTAGRAYPNVLMLQWLESHERNNPAAMGQAQQARDQLPGAYRALLNFECEKPGKPEREGFEWFGGKAKPHESLTAYGLLHFNDLKRVYNVDPALIERTKQFLLSRRDGKGGFLQNSDARDTFGRAPTDVANAYITWALRETDPALDLKKECNAVIEEAKKSGDPYRLALAAMTTSASSDAKPLLEKLRDKQSDNGGVAGAATSITQSAGPDLVTETTSLAILAWLRHGEEYSANIRKGLMFLMGQRQPGGTFGATQATVMALKAITESARTMTKLPENAKLTLTVNGKPQGTVSVKDGRVFTAAETDAWFVTGSADIRLESSLGVSLPVAVEWNCRTKTLPKPQNRDLEFNASLDSKDAWEGQFVKLNVSLKRLPGSKRDPGMLIATIGLPAGLTVPTDAKQLTELIERANAGEAFPAYWEMRGRDLVFYWRSLPATAQSTFSIDLIAEFPGEYRGSGNKVSPYYDPHSSICLPPLEFTIFPK